MLLNTWDHVILLGTDYYPLRTPEDVYKELKKLGDKTCIGETPMAKQYAQGSWQWNIRPWVSVNPVNNTFFAGNIANEEMYFDMFNDVHVYGGYQWLVFSRKFLNSMFVSPFAVALHARMEWIFAPEEFLYHTWGRNFVSQHIVDELKIYFDWPLTSPSSPVILWKWHLVFGSIDQAIERGKLYMRKVSNNYPEVMDYIDRKIFKINNLESGVENSDILNIKLHIQKLWKRFFSD
jgi:hypothetical protein